VAEKFTLRRQIKLIKIKTSMFFQRNAPSALIVGKQLPDNLETKCKHRTASPMFSWSLISNGAKANTGKRKCKMMLSRPVL
jgi:hypothetical protein